MGAELWHRLRAVGFRDSLPVVTEWTNRRRRSEAAGLELTRRIPSSRPLSRLMTTRRKRLSKAGVVIVAATETAVPALATTRDLLGRFHRLFRARDMQIINLKLVKRQMHGRAGLDLLRARLIVLA